MKFLSHHAHLIMNFRKKNQNKILWHLVRINLIWDHYRSVQTLGCAQAYPLHSWSQ